MKISFTKMSGAGNDFVVVDNRNGIITDPTKFSIAVCNRRLGIGADGVLLLENSTKADFLMQYYNADGSNAGMCGNGGRCIAKFAYDNFIVTIEKFKFEAFDYIYEISRHDINLYELKMKDPFELKLNQSIKIENYLLTANYLNTGTDHSVILLSENSKLGSLDSTDVFNIGRTVRYHQTYQPKGANVNFVDKIDFNTIQIRTYERGVEEETLACGTGSVASALLSSLKFGMQSPINVNVKSGATLRISFEKNGNNSFTNVTLKGPAENVFKGTIDVKNTFEIAYEL